MSGTVPSTESFFKNYDDPEVYRDIQGWLQSPSARNFVVEFGHNEAKIARDLDSAKFEQLIKHDESHRPPERPVRWINIWSPDQQHRMIDIIADKYGLSHRFRAILKSSPPPRPQDKEAITPAQSTNASPNNDIEYGNGTAERQPVRRIEASEDENHYAVAESLINYQSLDLGEEYISIGANWMYNMKGPDQRLWSWLILCDDSTLISLHEDVGPTDPGADYMKAVRGHLRSLLGQLSVMDTGNGGSMSLVSVRNILKSNISHDDDGSEGSSNLFYYLFDNWHSAYKMIIANQTRLQKLSTEILGVMNQKHQKEPNKDIIPGLYKIGKELRKNQHLYRSYKNIIERILKYKKSTVSQSGKRVAVALTASERFERLGDRIELLVLSSIDEAIAEKDALLNTYFQITAQKDSAATAKLSRNATLLSKLGVLFLPVSLMTSYFSTQIQDLQNIYTAKTYWVSFAIIMAISFIALFFLSRVLVTVTESLESRVRRTSSWCTKKFGRKPKKNAISTSSSTSSSYEK